MKKNLILIIMSSLLCACAQNMEIKLDEVRSGYQNANYVMAAEKMSGKKTIEKQNNLELLISADALFHSNNFHDSDQAYEEFNHRNIDLTSGDFGREAGALLGGNMANSYRPYMMDSLFVSYYQIWNALADNRLDDARVIINQSYARQQNMSMEYANLIENTQQSAAENYTLANNLHQQSSHWAAFRNIMNPALTYLSGIYFLNMGEFADAKTYLERASEMMPGNNYMAEDFKSAKSGRIPTDTAWVFIESGFAPKLVENRIDMPWLSGNGISVISIAVSEPLFFENPIYIDDSKLLSDVDAMFITEYSEYRINEAMRAWVSAVSKAVLQAAANAAAKNSDNPYASLFSLATSIYSIASTSAEVRTWATLPKNIYLLRVKKDKSGLIELKSGGTMFAKIAVPKTGNNLVYIRMVGNSYDSKIIKIK